LSPRESPATLRSREYKSAPAVRRISISTADTHTETESLAMKAVRIHAYGGPEQLRLEENVPEPAVNASTVVIAVAAASVNPIDWKVRSGARQKDFPLTLPAILGRDVSGTVRAIGSNVHNFKVGDRVAATTNATYAELVGVESSLVTHLPDGVDLVDSAAIPLISLTGDQLVRVATRVRQGQTILVSGALGSVGRAAVHTAKKIGARIIAGVRTKQLSEAAALQTWGVIAIDNDEDIARLSPLDAVADTVGGETAVKLLAKIAEGGSFGYASVLPEAAKTQYPGVEIKRVFAQPDPSKVREFADDIRDGKFVLPIARRMPLAEAAEAHRLVEKGGAGKIILRVA
jgi:NADPH:quinone reductase-like Zn-dependent oxidoreductase